MPASDLPPITSKVTVRAKLEGLAAGCPLQWIGAWNSSISHCTAPRSRRSVSPCSGSGPGSRAVSRSGTRIPGRCAGAAGAVRQQPSGRSAAGGSEGPSTQGRHRSIRGRLAGTPQGFARAPLLLGESARVEIGLEGGCFACHQRGIGVRLGVAPSCRLGLQQAETACDVVLGLAGWSYRFRPQRNQLDGGLFQGGVKGARPLLHCSQNRGIARSSRAVS